MSFITIPQSVTNEDIYQGALRLFEILSNKILFIKAPLQRTQLTDMTYQINPGSYTMIIMEQPKKKDL